MSMGSVALPSLLSLAFSFSFLAFSSASCFAFCAALISSSHTPAECQRSRNCDKGIYQGAGEGGHYASQVRHRAVTESEIQVLRHLGQRTVPILEVQRGLWALGLKRAVMV